MTQPGSIANNMPAGDDYLVRRLAQLESKVQSLETARALQDVSTSAVQVASAWQSTQGFTVTTDGERHAVDATLTVPDGKWSRVLINISAIASVTNLSAAADTLFVTAAWDVSGGRTSMQRQFSTVTKDYTATVASQLGGVVGVENFPDLFAPGTPWTFSARASSQVAAWPVAPANSVTLLVTATFVR